MILGIGVDLVDLARFEQHIIENPRLAERLFHPDELHYEMRQLAGSFAAKEALVKALGGPDGLTWVELKVTRDNAGKPWLCLLYTSDAADEEDSVDLGGRRIIKKKKKKKIFFKQKTAYEIMPSLVGSEMCIRDRPEPARSATGRSLCTTCSKSCAFAPAKPAPRLCDQA